jgi:hypothetical protein
MARKVTINEWNSKVGRLFKAWLDTPEQIHGAPIGRSKQEALDELAKSPDVHPQHRAFVARAAIAGCEIEEGQ